MSAVASSRKINVLFLENELMMGGLEKKLFDFVPRLDRNRFRPSICCLKQGGYFKRGFVEAGIPFDDGLLRHRFDVMAYRRLRRIVRRERTDIIYTVPHPNTIIFAAVARVTRAVPAVVLSIHGTGSSRGGRMFPPYLKPFVSRIDRYIALAETHKRYLTQVEGLDASRVAVIPNGVDTERFYPGAVTPQGRAALGLPERGRWLVAVAQLNAHKNIDVLLRAAAPIVGDDKIVVVGDGPERSRLEHLARELGINGNVAFAGMREDVPEILRQSDLLVLPSRTEAAPNVVLEAMATGLPVVATDVGSVRDIVVDGQTGVIVPRSDVEALRGAIGALLAAPERMRAYGTRGRQVVEERYQLRDMYERREELFEEVLAEKP